MPSARPHYKGQRRKLILAFDVGTTFSGISYCVLDPGQVSQIRRVTRFPAQEAGGDYKIPTIIYYDQQGNVRAVGAEAVHDGIEAEAEDGQWAKAEWFKLHLCPRSQSSAHVPQQVPPLPQGKSAIDVFADFLRYLHSCARTYIEETHANGVELWRTLKDHTEFVLAHPNGWEGVQQSMMRKAAVQAGLISNNQNGNSHLSFVTEGEASLHFCVKSGLTNNAIQNGKGLLIIDAGGGTIDISAYRRKSPHSQSYEEIAAPQCHFRGSIFVTGQARSFLNGFLDQSRFAEDVPHIVKCFDQTTKLRFRNADVPQYIRFGSIRDTDPELNIRSGQLKLLGSDVGSFFEPSVQCIVKAVEEQCKTSLTKITSAFLVGGFAASDWLYQKLKDPFTSQGLEISRPETHANKAVADGAVSFYIDHFVSTRVSKFAYGVETCQEYNARNAAAQSPPSSKAASPTLPTAGSPSNPNKPPADALPAFITFLTNEKQRLTQKRQAFVKSDMDKRMAELVKFNKDFKLNKPIPEDLVPILAKDEGKQQAIKEKASKDAASSQARAIGASASRGPVFAGAKNSNRSRKPIAQALGSKNASNNAQASITAANAQKMASVAAASAAATSAAELAESTSKKINMVIPTIPPFRRKDNKGKQNAKRLHPRSSAHS